MLDKYYELDNGIKEMIGKTFVKVEQYAGEELLFLEEDGSYFKFYHAQSCCEAVEIEDIVGNLEDLELSPILMAEEVVEERDTGRWENSETWTFYKFATIKGYVTVRWVGSSNGYYSESVNLERYIEEGENNE